jgi:type II secretory pathway pseudopilin PulG
MVVVAVIGLLCAIVLPAFAKARRSTQNNAAVNDLRISTSAFEQVAMIRGTYPPDTTPSVMPQGMSEHLAKMDWRGTTPVGGKWDWDYMQFGNKIGVSIYFGNNSQDERMLELDRIIDDGDLNTGMFQSRFGGYIYIIEQR